MSQIYRTYFPKALSNEAILFYFISLGLVAILFSTIPFHYMLFSIAALVSFYYYLNTLTRKWQFYPEAKFKKKLFETALIIRLVYVVFIYFYFIQMTGNAFEYGAHDSIHYHNRAEVYADLEWDELKYHLQNEINNELSDSGFRIYLTFIYSLIGSYLLPIRLLNALFSALTCLLIYNLANRNFGEITAKIAALMSMLLPNFIYYTGVHLKETIMVLCIVAFIDRADVLIRKRKLSYINILLMLIYGLLLFSFRTALGAAAFLSLFTALTFSQTRLVGWGRRILIGFWVGISILFFFSGSIEEEVTSMIEDRGTSQEKNMEFRSTRIGGNQLAKYGTSAVFAPIILAAPFPTFIHIEHQVNLMLLSGAYFVRNVYAFFILLALFILYKNKEYKNHLLLISFMLGYLVVLVQSPFALSERFHMPVVPFLLVFAAYGITHMNKKQRNLFIPYLVLITVVIIAWSWFKLAGRGMLD